jgi:hypothetical protein
MTRRWLNRSIPFFKKKQKNKPKKESSLIKKVEFSRKRLCSKDSKPENEKNKIVGEKKENKENRKEKEPKAKPHTTQLHSLYLGSFLKQALVPVRNKKLGKTIHFSKKRHNLGSQVFACSVPR